MSKDVRPQFQSHTSVNWDLKHRCLQLFQQAAYKIVIRCRMNRRLVCLRKLIKEMKKAPTAEEDVKLVKYSKISAEKAFIYPHPTFSEQDDPLALDLSLLPAVSTDLTVTPSIPFFRLKVPHHYKLMDYKPVSLFEAYTSYISASLPRPLRPLRPLPAEEEPQEGAAKDSGSLLFEHEENTDGAEAKLEGFTFSFSAPDFKPIPAHPLRIFNPAPGLHAHLPVPKYLEWDPEYDLCPLPTYHRPDPDEETSVALVHPKEKEVMEDIMSWKRGFGASVSACLAKHRAHTHLQLPASLQPEDSAQFFQSVSFSLQPEDSAQFFQSVSFSLQPEDSAQFFQSVSFSLQPEDSAQFCQSVSFSLQPEDSAEFCQSVSFSLQPEDSAEFFQSVSFSLQPEDSAEFFQSVSFSLQPEDSAEFFQSVSFSLQPEDSAEFFQSVSFSLQPEDSAQFFQSVSFSLQPEDSAEFFQSVSFSLQPEDSAQFFQSVSFSLQPEDSAQFFQFPLVCSPRTHHPCVPVIPASLCPYVPVIPVSVPVIPASLCPYVPVIPVSVPVIPASLCPYVPVIPVSVPVIPASLCPYDVPVIPVSVPVSLCPCVCPCVLMSL
uniref:Uncharacterized protein n=1 Tax=Knipowitschia caucasica TaxID=637954 RepID=A0AAV2LCE7_KNICA